MKLAPKRGPLVSPNPYTPVAARPDCLPAALKSTDLAAMSKPVYCASPSRLSVQPACTKANTRKVPKVLVGQGFVKTLDMISKTD